MEPKTSLGWLNKISHIPLDAGAEEEARHQDVIIAILMLTGSVVITGLSIWDLLVGMGPAWINLITLAVGLLATVVYLVLLRSGKTSLLMTLVLMIFLHFFWLITGDVEWAGMLWCLVMLPLFFHLLGHRKGSKLVSIIILMSAIVLLWPNAKYLYASYSLDMRYRFLLAYLVLAWISFMVEYVRYQTRQRFQEARENLNHQARTDELTGLANRRGFKEYLGESEQRRESGKGLFAVIIGDLDNFKQINDEYGHDVGDFVLQEIGHTLKKLVRTEDLVVRWGGEEFLILMADTDLKGAEVLAEKIRQDIASTSVAVEGGQVAVTMSLGVDAQKPQGDLYFTLGSADRAMYEAKRRGRDCVVAAEVDGGFGEDQTIPESSAPAL
ncbi:MAG: diguanylate cyclase [Porticoccus sp.]